MKRNFEKLFLLLIFIAALLLRIICLNIFPITFNQDEVLNGYEAYSLLKTGRDHRGNFLPLYFEAFSDRVDVRNHIFYPYITIPFIAFLGLNEFSTRLPSVIFGFLTVLLTYFLTKELFKKRSIALLATFFLTISPWHIFLSRASFEAITVPFFISLTILFFLKGLKKPKFIVLSAVPLALNFYTYAITKVYNPLLLIGSLIIYRKRVWQWKKYIILSIFVFLAIASPFLYTQLTNWQKIQGRFYQVSVFNFSFWPILFFINYLVYLSPKFLFTHYLLPILIAALMGIYFLWQKRGLAKHRLLFWILIISLLPAALTFPNPGSLRSVPMLPFLEIIAAYGCYKIYFLLKERLQINPRKIIFSLSSILFLSLILNADFLFKIGYPYNYERTLYQFGFKEVINYIKENQDKYTKIVFTNKANQPYIYFLFYLKYDPKKFQSIEVKRVYRPDNWQEVVSFDKYEFCDINQCYDPHKNYLYVARAEEIPHIKEKKMFYNLDGSVFRIITND
ncbi:MAG: glycosyltransferase family 39 protein [Patescibacteria group bacterium]|nr:glycosyltransferase family 39 protein [Patescibacteria group bacterium]